MERRRLTVARPGSNYNNMTLHSSESGRTYELGHLIGKGGFGEVYLATSSPAASPTALPPTSAAASPASDNAEKVCIKITDRLSAWLREAYFAEMLAREPRALRVFDRFAVVEGTKTRYCLAMEYAEHGDLGAWIAKKGPQPERFVRREIAAILA